MNRSPKSRIEKLKNPLTGVLFWYGTGSLVFVGMTIVTGQDWLLSQSVVWILFVAALLITAHTFLAMRIGTISTVSSLGQTISYRRNKEPVGFFVLVVLYLSIDSFLTVFLGYSLFFG